MIKRPFRLIPVPDGRKWKLLLDRPGGRLDLKEGRWYRLCVEARLMRKYAISFVVACAWILVVIQARADTIYLKNGNQIEGIITRETDEFIYIEMPAGNMSLSKSAIELIQRSSSEAVEKTKVKWERERKKKEQEQAEKASFEDRQRAKGLVMYNGAWITPEKRAEIEKQEIAAGTGESLEKDIADLRRELDSLKTENSDLKQEIAKLRDQIGQHSQEQIKLSREMLKQQQEALEFQKKAEKREIGQRPPHIWVAPKIDGFTPYPTPSD